MQRQTTSQQSEPAKKDDQAQKFRVAEIFGPTIQGEGALIGAQTHFIRFGGCDYRCSWCDSMHAVDPEQVAKLEQLTVSEIVEHVKSLGRHTNWVTLSGGNPALFNLATLVQMLQDSGYQVAVETQGTQYKEWLQLCDLVTVSPKPPSAGNVTDAYTLQRFMAPFSPSMVAGWVKVVLKVVVFDQEDFEYAARILSHYSDYERWVQVGNTQVDPDTPPDVSKLLTSLRGLSFKVLHDERMRGVRVTPQMHTLIWGNERGR